LFIYGYPVCDLTFITSQAKGMAFVHLEAKHLGQSTLGASWHMKKTFEEKGFSLQGGNNFRLN
jgi:hypothetical protein